MKDVLHLWHLRSTYFLSVATPLSTFAKIRTSVILLGSLFLVISGLTTGGGLKNRGQRLFVVAGMIGLLYEGARLYWHVSAGSLQSLGFASTYSFFYRLFGGIALAVLLYIVLPKSPKPVLIISVSLLVAINVAVNIIAIAHYGRHGAWALLAFCNASLIGTSITSAILLWFERRRQRCLSNTVEDMDKRHAAS